MCDERDRRGREAEMSGVCCWNILCYWKGTSQGWSHGLLKVFYTLLCKFVDFPKIRIVHLNLFKDSCFFFRNHRVNSGIFGS